MKGGKNLADMQHELKLKEYIRTQECLVCKKSIPAPYGRFTVGWTCSKQCYETYYRSLHDSLSRGNCEKA